jgi:hypothetical protein
MSVLEMRGASIGLGVGNEAVRQRYESVVQSTSGATFAVRSTSAELGCGLSDEGTYGWTLSPGGSRLSIVTVVDECASRALAIAGTWNRIACRNPEGLCLGPLEAGEVRSGEFDPFGTGRSGQLVLDVPQGWTNSADFPSNYFLRPTRDVDGDESFDGNDTVSGIYVWAGVTTADDPCAFTGVEDAPSDATSIADALEQLPGLDVTDRSVTTIGGRQAVSLALGLRASWQQSCPFIADGSAFHGVVAARSGSAVPFMWGIGETEQMRLFLVDVAPQDTIAIIIDLATSGGTFATFDELEAAALPIVTSMQLVP